VGSFWRHYSRPAYQIKEIITYRNGRKAARPVGDCPESVDHRSCVDVRLLGEGFNRRVGKASIADLLHTRGPSSVFTTYFTKYRIAVLAPLERDAVRIQRMQTRIRAAFF